MLDSALGSTDVEIACRNCGASLVVERGHLTADCPYCASANVIERPAAPDRPVPRFALGFALDRERASEIARSWLGKRGLFAHGGLRSAVVERARGVYLPAYLYSAAASARYAAEIGEDYTDVETYTTTDSKGNVHVHTRTVVRTEWRDLEGEWSAYLPDVLVTASRGVSNEELERIEPYELRALRRHSPALIAGWIAEEPSLARANCLELAHREATETVGRLLEGFLPGDQHRGLRFSIDVRDEAAELTLLPLWVFAIRYAEGKPPMRLLVNGQTGEVAGKVPLSLARIALAVLLGLGLVAALVFALALAS